MAAPNLSTPLSRMPPSACFSLHQPLVSSTGLIARKRGRLARTTLSCQRELQISKCSPFLETHLLSDNIAPKFGEWKVVPDIWRTCAETFGDRVALVDSHHHPPAKFTYKQLEKEILDFCQGLRVMGVKPDEKVALFSENSCRWLIADQGVMATGAVNVVRGSRSSADELLHIYNHSQSTALIVDSPRLLSRVAQPFSLDATVKFVILLWGEKSQLERQVLDKFSVVTYTEVIELGRQSRQVLVESADDASKTGTSLLTIQHARWLLFRNQT